MTGDRWTGVLGVVALAAELVACPAPDREAMSQLQLQVSRLEARMDSLAEVVRLGEALKEFGATELVDLRETKLQDIADGFKVGEMKVAAERGGVRVSGTLVNQLAVDHADARFRLYVRGQTRDFIVTAIARGGSASFSVLVPGVETDSVRYGSIKYLESRLQYGRSR